MDRDRSTPDGPVHRPIDTYLARCVVSCLRSQPLPGWPDHIALTREQIAGRIAFHGIALLLLQHPDLADVWPAPIAQEMREEARRQSFWETSHREAIGRLLDAFHAAGVEAVVTKGTALAYSVYDEPAVRRRGDSDIVITSGPKAAIRKVLRACGFSDCRDTRALQESWATTAPPNFNHQVDLHWRIQASAAISKRLEAIDPFERAIALPRLSAHARGLGLPDNLLLTCINRAAHASYGYLQGPDRLFEGDRLIWAVDIDLVAQTLSGGDWDALLDRAKRSGTMAILASGLTFAADKCQTAIPPSVIKRLEHDSGTDDVLPMLDRSAARERLRMDLAACPTWTEKAQVMRYVLFPSAYFLRARFPDAAHWPTPILAVRRIVAGLMKPRKSGAERT